MAGGTFVTRNKVRAGAYINFVSEYSPLGTAADRGVVLLPMALPFGPVGKAAEVEGNTDVRKLFGLSGFSEELTLLREAAKRARKVLVWRLGGGEKASCTDGVLTVTAKYPGSGGNRIAVKVLSGTGNMFTVETYLSGRMVEQQQAANAEELKENSWVVFSGTDALTPHAGIVLSGGSDREVTEEDWEEFFLVAETLTYNTMAVPTSDAGIKEKAVSFIRRMREDEGVKVQAVVAGLEADYEGIISAANGVILSDGRKITPEEATAYIAGMTAGAAVNKSCTYDTYDGAVAAEPSFLSSEVEKKIGQGQLIFISRGNKAVVEQDINTFTGFSAEKGDAFRKNRTLRVMDAIGGDVRRIFEDYYLGKCANDEDGRALFREELFAYLKNLYNLRAVEQPQLSDIEVRRGETADSVIVEMGVQPVDSMEKLYMTVTVG